MGSRDGGMGSRDEGREVWGGGMKGGRYGEEG